LFLNSIEIQEIFKLLPHRYPFLLIDRVIDYEADKHISALKNVSVNEPYFQGHFPIKPVMPGVLQIEAIAQATGILGALSTPIEEAENRIYYLIGVDKARFKRQVVPGDQLLIEVDFKNVKRNFWMFKGRVSVEGKTSAVCEIMCTPRND
jgi:3-hydroxyacyl-[acyl-carrier-protein] dehydratase